MDMQAPNVDRAIYATIPGIPELGMVWMSDMMVHSEPPHELMLDPRQAESPFFTHTPHSFEDLQAHQLPGTTMVRYLPPQFQTECSEADEAVEAMDVHEMHHDYDPHVDGQDMNEYLSLEDYMGDDDREQIVSNAATQTQDSRTRKIKPIKHPGLVLKTPIAYQPHTDLNFIPIRKDGIAVCEKCGAIGVKHAFYTKERRFCSRACARSSEYGPNYPADMQDASNSPALEDFKAMAQNMLNQHNPVKDEMILQKEQYEIHDSKKPIMNFPPVSTPISLPVNSSLTFTPHTPMPSLVPVPTVPVATPVPTAPPLPPPTPVLPQELPVRRKRTSEMDGSYDWTPQLTEPGFCAAPVSCFKHAPISEMWDNISVGMKVEVENTDCDEICEEFPDSFWVATVLRISGYRALLRYEGFGQNAEKDFWVSLCSDEIHPVGWCASIGKPLIPPNSIANKYKDWKDFLTRRLTGARTLPSNFYSKVKDSMSSIFECGLQLEVVDKNRISQVKVATVQKIVGKRLHVRYYDSAPEDNGFWCHEDSSLIHPVGWAKRIGQALDAYPEYLERIEKSIYVDSDARDHLFYVPQRLPHLAPSYTFREGMKIEAIDPLNLSAICAATIMRVLRDNYIMIRIDSYDQDTTGGDWFCYHSGSPCIFPVGFCAQHGLPLIPPKGYDAATFSWDTYLSETSAMPAPINLFNWDIPQHGFIEGMRLEAADLMDPRLVCVATITRVIGRLLRVHFDGWEEEYDQWMDCQSPDIYPVGWCDLVNHKLEGPRVPVKNTSPTGGLPSNPTRASYFMKSPRGLKRKGKRKIKKGSRILTRSTLSRQSGRLNTFRDQDLDHEIEPAQGTKIERERDLESIPEQRSREPEPAQEPAGPDQTLPSPTSGQGQAAIQLELPLELGINLDLDLEQPPNMVHQEDPVDTSFIHVPPIRRKYIPRLVDGSCKPSDSGELIPTEWNVTDVAEFLRINDCGSYCDNFSKRNIDGKALLVLTKDQIIDLTGFKVGPSLKIFHLIQQLKIKVNPAQERLKLGLKKIL